MRPGSAEPDDAVRDAERDVAVRVGGLEPAGGLPGQGAEVGRGAVQVGAAQAGPSQEVVQEGGHILAGLADAVQAVPGGAVEAVAVVLGQGQAVAVHGAQRDAQVVGDVVGEGGQFVVGGLGLAELAGEPLFHLLPLGHVPQDDAGSLPAGCVGEDHGRELAGKRGAVAAPEGHDVPELSGGGAPGFQGGRVFAVGRVGDTLAAQGAQLFLGVAEQLAGRRIRGEDPAVWRGEEHRVEGVLEQRLVGLADQPGARRGHSAAIPAPRLRSAGANGLIGHLPFRWVRSSGHIGG